MRGRTYCGLVTLISYLHSKINASVMANDDGGGQNPLYVLEGATTTY